MYETISELVSRYTKVTRDPVSGKYFGSCPFCHGRTDTFMADDRKGIFFCYACGASGDKKDFLARLEPNKYAMVTCQKNPVLLQIYEDTAYFYYTELIKAEHPGRQYLASRGITLDGIREYGLGFAPDGFSVLYSRLKRRYRHGELMASGFFKLSARGYPYDFFRNRVMFPIMDENGDVIAFGGRVLDDSRPKYLNSPETELFSKRRNLYGFPYMGDIRGQALILCEGYLDYIALHRAGFRDSAAVLGTALTEEHARLIAARYKEVFLSMDSDEAGIHGAKKSIDLLRKAGLSVKVLDFSPYKDPDELIREDPMGMDEFRKRIEQALPAHMFLARHTKDTGELIDILMQQVL